MCITPLDHHMTLTLRHITQDGRTTQIFGWENQQNHNQEHNKPYQANQYQNHNSNHQSNNNKSYQNPPHTSYPSNQKIHNHQDTLTPTSQPCEIKGNFERVEAAIAQLSSQFTGAISTLLERQAQAKKKIDANQEEYRSNLKNQGAAISKLEAQMGFLSKQIPMPTHIFPSDTMANPRGECKTITLRSGKVIEEATQNQENHKEEAAEKPENRKKEEVPSPSSPRPILKPYVPKAPYPQRLMKDGKDRQFSRVLKIFKKLQINILFAEALEQLPLYAKFLKELMTRKRNWGEKETVVLTEECCAIIQKKLPKK
nr:uncharacterized protein LOC112746447 [Arachis hypogaea]